MRIDKRFGIADDRPVEINVFPAGQLRVKAGAQREQLYLPPVHQHTPARRNQRAGYDFEQRALARTVGADDARHLTPSHMKAHVVERAKPLISLLSAQGTHHPFLDAGRFILRPAEFHGYVFNRNIGARRRQAIRTLLPHGRLPHKRCMMLLRFFRNTTTPSRQIPAPQSTICTHSIIPGSSPVITAPRMQWMYTYSGLT